MTPSNPAGTNYANNYETKNKKDKNQGESNYGYLNTRLRSRFRLLYSEEDYHRMIKGTLQSLELKLLESEYEPYLREKLLTSTNAQTRINEALTQGVSSRLQEVHAWARGDLSFLLEVISSRSDIDNGLLFLRAFYSATPSSRPLSLQYGTTQPHLWDMLWAHALDFDDIWEICHYDDSKESTYLAEACQNIRQNKFRLWQAEFHYISSIIQYKLEHLRKIKGENALLVGQWLARYSDCWNITIWLRAQRWGYQDGNLRYLPFGSIAPEDLYKAKSLQSLFRNTFWGKLTLDLQEDDGDASIFAMESHFLKWQQRLRLQNPLGINVAIAYMASMAAEWRNLGVITTGLKDHENKGTMHRLLLPSPW